MVRGQDISERLLAFAVQVIELLDELPETRIAAHVSGQLVRAATSAGANYEEARRAESRADFIHKVSVSAKEASEALYWLRIIHRLRLTTTTPPLREADELIAILVASARTARAR